jgi:hypothetical protein
MKLGSRKPNGVRRTQDYVWVELASRLSTQPDTWLPGKRTDWLGWSNWQTDQLSNWLYEMWGYHAGEDFDIGLLGDKAE